MDRLQYFWIQNDGDRMILLWLNTPKQDPVPNFLCFPVSSVVELEFQEFCGPWPSHMTQVLLFDSREHGATLVQFLLQNARFSGPAEDKIWRRILGDLLKSGSLIESWDPSAVRQKLDREIRDRSRNLVQMSASSVRILSESALDPKGIAALSYLDRCLTRVLSQMRNPENKASSWWVFSTTKAQEHKKQDDKWSSWEPLQVESLRENNAFALWDRARSQSLLARNLREEGFRVQFFYQGNVFDAVVVSWTQARNGPRKRM